MVFNLTAEKNVIIDGKIITFNAGKLDTKDKKEIEALSKCKGVEKVVAKK